MIRQIFVPLALVAAALVMGGCATTRNVAGEPSPKDVGDAPAETAQAPAEAPATGAPPDQPPPADAPPAAPQPPPSGFVPAAKQEIVARVEKVQFPAWVERGGIRASIKSGWAIFTADRIVTGSDGRVELGIAGGGNLKISGDADIAVTPAFEFTGNAEPTLLSVRRGAIQYAAPLARTGSGGTSLDFGDAIVADVTAGRLMGRVDSSEAMIALVDAVVKISGPKLNPGTMREPNTFLRVPRQGRANAVTNASDERMARWLSSAETIRGRPTLTADGTWDVSLNSGYSVKELEGMACRIQRRGFPTEIYPVKEPGKLTWYRVVVRRFATKGDAVNFLGTAKSLGSKEPWVLVPQS
jgi:SPOR domain